MAHLVSWMGTFSVLIVVGFFVWEGVAVREGQEGQGEVS